MKLPDVNHEQVDRREIYHWLFFEDSNESTCDRYGHVILEGLDRSEKKPRSVKSHSTLPHQHRIKRLTKDPGKVN